MPVQKGSHSLKIFFGGTGRPFKESEHPGQGPNSKGDKMMIIYLNWVYVYAIPIISKVTPHGSSQLGRTFL